jgi:hypothetical protein
MFRKSIPLIVVAVLVIGAVIFGAALNAHPTNAQASNMKTLIQSLVDKKQGFTINTRVTNFEIDGAKNTISQLGDDFFCVTGDLNVMGKSMQTICTSFDGIIVVLN